MIIGIDFDNTIIDYHTLFYQAGISLGIISGRKLMNKTEIRQYLIDSGNEAGWITIQGEVYGRYIADAKIMEGFLAFSDLCSRKGWKIFIISHKTKTSPIGKNIYLHEAALRWLSDKAIFGKGIQSSVEGVFFEDTRREKISRINQLGCKVFIDDLVDVLTHPDLKHDIIKIHIKASERDTKYKGIISVTGWNEIGKKLSGIHA